MRASVAVDHPSILRWLGYYHHQGGGGGEGGGRRGRDDRDSGSEGGRGWRLGAVLEWSPGYESLGLPPSLETVTRDTYREGSSFGGREIRAIALSIGAALEHVHSRGLCHGDLYAHNILWSAPSRSAKLSDFGAAFYYGRASADGAAYERIEQRAFGVLLGELLARHDGSEPRQLPAVRSVAKAALAAGGGPGFSVLTQLLSISGEPAAAGDVGSVAHASGRQPRPTRVLRG